MIGQQPLKDFYKKKKMGELPDLDNQGLTIACTNGHIIIWLNDNPKYLKENLDTLIHESVHVFQAAMKYVQEEKPGDEVQAYHIASICTNMIKDYARQAALKEPPCPT